MIGAEADGIATSPNSFAAKLADVVLSPRRHFRRCRIADMGIVRPDNPLALLAMVTEQNLERGEHVIVTQVPGGT